MTAAIRIPSGHGEVITEPPYETWAALARRTASESLSWTFEVAEMPAPDLRDLARREAVEAAVAFTSRIGITARPVEAAPSLLVMTGHQPEFYHPGVWVKDFLLQRLSDETGAAAIELVVDSDGFDSVAAAYPCMRPEPRRCSAVLAKSEPEGSFSTAPVPSLDDVERFCEEVAGAAAAFPESSPARDLERFCDAMRTALPVSAGLADLMTSARRRYESVAGTDYLDLPVVTMCRGRAFLTLVSHVGRDARRFADSYNDSLAEHRRRTGTRSSAQPVPDLRVVDGAVELPLWVIRDGRRYPVWAGTEGTPALISEGRTICLLDGDDGGVGSLLASGAVFAPKALLLTLFARLFLADLFIHGVGGSRYDQVTDGLIRRYFAVEPPPYAVATMTMFLPLGGPAVQDEEIADLTMRLNRLGQNPDQMLGEIGPDDAVDRSVLERLVAEKAELVSGIAAEGADKKALGSRIREVNAAIGVALAPVEARLRRRLADLRSAREAADVLRDRSYPFCFWDPREIADRVR